MTANHQDHLHRWSRALAGNKYPTCQRIQTEAHGGGSVHLLDIRPAAIVHIALETREWSQRSECRRSSAVSAPAR